MEILDEKAFFATINQVATLSLRTYGMTVKNNYNSLINRELRPIQLSGYVYGKLQKCGCLPRYLQLCSLLFLLRPFPFSRRDSNPQPSDRQADTTESQVYDMEELTKIAKTVLLENLPQDGGLVRIVTAWPTLSDELKIAIIKMIS